MTLRNGEGIVAQQHFFDEEASQGIPEGAPVAEQEERNGCDRNFGIIVIAVIFLAGGVLGLIVGMFCGWDTECPAR